MRRAAEGKAAGQAEALEWKRRYELERARNQQLECKEQLPGEHRGIFDGGSAENPVNEPLQQNQLNEHSCTKHGNGISSHEVFRDSQRAFMETRTQKFQSLGQGLFKGGGIDTTQNR